MASTVAAGVTGSGGICTRTFGQCCAIQRKVACAFAEAGVLLKPCKYISGRKLLLITA